MTTAPPTDGGRRGSSRRSCPAPDGAGPAAAIGVSPQGRPGSWRRQAQARQTVETRSVHRGRHADTPSLLTACGTPDASGAFVATTLVCLLPLHTRLRTHRASGVPRALSQEGGTFPHSSGAIASRDREAASAINHCRCLTFESDDKRRATSVARTDAVILRRRSGAKASKDDVANGTLPDTILRGSPQDAARTSG